MGLLVAVHKPDQVVVATSANVLVPFCEEIQANLSTHFAFLFIQLGSSYSSQRYTKDTPSLAFTSDVDISWCYFAMLHAERR